MSEEYLFDPAGVVVSSNSFTYSNLLEIFQGMSHDQNERIEQWRSMERDPIFDIYVKPTHTLVRYVEAFYQFALPGTHYVEVPQILYRGYGRKRQHIRDACYDCGSPPPYTLNNSGSVYLLSSDYVAPVPFDMRYAPPRRVISAFIESKDLAWMLPEGSHVQSFENAAERSGEPLHVGKFGDGKKGILIWNGFVNGQGQRI